MNFNEYVDNIFSFKKDNIILKFDINNTITNIDDGYSKYDISEIGNKFWNIDNLNLIEKIQFCDTSVDLLTKEIIVKDFSMDDNKKLKVDEVFKPFVLISEIENPKYNDQELHELFSKSYGKNIKSIKTLHRISLYFDNNNYDVIKNVWNNNKIKKLNMILSFTDMNRNYITEFKNIIPHTVSQLNCKVQVKEKTIESIYTVNFFVTNIKYYNILTLEELSTINTKLEEEKIEKLKIFGSYKNIIDNEENEFNIGLEDSIDITKLNI